MADSGDGIIDKGVDGVVLVFVYLARYPSTNVMFTHKCHL